MAAHRWNSGASGRTRVYDRVPERMFPSVARQSGPLVERSWLARKLRRPPWAAGDWPGAPAAAGPAADSRDCAATPVDRRALDAVLGLARPPGRRWPGAWRSARSATGRCHARPGGQHLAFAITHHQARLEDPAFAVARLFAAQLPGADQAIGLAKADALVIDQLGRGSGGGHAGRDSPGRRKRPGAGCRGSDAPGWPARRRSRRCAPGCRCPRGPDRRSDPTATVRLQQRIAVQQSRISGTCSRP